jgi:hypothetical protein
MAFPILLAGLGALAGCMSNPGRRKARRKNPISHHEFTLGGVERHGESVSISKENGVYHVRRHPSVGWFNQAYRTLTEARRQAKKLKSNPRARRNAPMTRGQARAMKAVLKAHRYRCNPKQIDTHAAEELMLYIVNDSDLYRGHTQAILNNLARKVKKGVFDQAKSVILWGYLADAGAKKYTKEMGSSKLNGSYGIFDKLTRMGVAVALSEYYKDELAEVVQNNPRRRRAKRSRR